MTHVSVALYQNPGPSRAGFRDILPTEPVRQHSYAREVQKTGPT